MVYCSVLVFYYLKHTCAILPLKRHQIEYGIWIINSNVSNGDTLHKNKQILECILDEFLIITSNLYSAIHILDKSEGSKFCLKYRVVFNHCTIAAESQRSKPLFCDCFCFLCLLERTV